MFGKWEFRHLMSIPLPACMEWEFRHLMSIPLPACMEWEFRHQMLPLPVCLEWEFRHPMLPLTSFQAFKWDRAQDGPRWNGSRIRSDYTNPRAALISCGIHQLSKKKCYNYRSIYNYYNTLWSMTSHMRKARPLCLTRLSSLQMPTIIIPSIIAEIPI
jgi:hypothetical protein